MNEQTLRILDQQVRRLYREASLADDDAHEHEVQAAARRQDATLGRIAAAEIQALIDAAADDGLCATPLEAQGVDDREVQHVDTDEQEEPAGVLPPHVWLYRNMLTDLQALAPLGVDETNGQYAVAVDQLVLSQYEIPHIKQQLDKRSRDLQEAARPAVPYDHVWRRHQYCSASDLGADWVYYGDFVAWPWAALDERHRVGLKMAPANANDSQNQSVN